MFNLKNRAIQLKMVKTDDAVGDSNDSRISMPTLDPEQINTILKDQATHVGKVIVGVAAGLTVLHTISEIAINNTNPLLRK